MSRLDTLLAVAALTLGGLCLMLNAQLREEREELGEVRARLRELEREVQSPRPSVAPLPPAAAVAAPSPVARAAAARPAKDAAAGEDARRRMMERFRLQMSDPEYRAAWIAQQRLMIQRRYPDLAADLGLDAGQAERLFELLAGQMAADQAFHMELSARDAAPGTEPDAEALRERQRLVEARQQQHEDERRALLGEDTYQAWRDYQNSREARAQMQELRGRLADGTSPLLDGQFDQLVSVLVTEQQRYRDEVQSMRQLLDLDNPSIDPQAGWGEFQERRMALLESSHARARDAAGAYMNDEQLRQYQAMQRAELERERVQLRLWRARRDAKARAGVD